MKKLYRFTIHRHIIIIIIINMRQADLHVSLTVGW